MHGGQVALKRIIEPDGGHGLKVIGISSGAGHRMTAAAHARVVSQSSFFQVQMRQCGAATYSLLLKTTTPHRNTHKAEEERKENMLEGEEPELKKEE